MTFTKLSKNSKQDMSNLPGYRLAILGDCATQHLSVALRGYGFEQGIALELFDAAYNQILPQIMDETSEMYAFKPDMVLIFMCAESLYDLWCATPENNRISFADEVFSTIASYWTHLASYCNAKIAQFTFAENNDCVFGNLTHSSSYIYQLRKLNLLLMENKDVFLVDLCGIQAQTGRNFFFDPKMYYLAKMPISLATLPVVAKNVIDVILSLLGVTKKCIVLDLDNTLWGGIIGDDGLNGIEIGEFGLGRTYTAFQCWLKELKKRGILLAVCSKNEERTAKEPFESHPGMVLRLHDFAMFVANWKDKAENIRQIQTQLNIGMDSIVFIDDNPFERDLVRTLIPEIAVPDLPEDPAEYIPFLQNLNLFETTTFSDADTKRTEQYRAEIGRTAMRQQFASYDEYLQNLEMIGTAAPFDELHAPRIAQLTQRSNQFNLRTIRYTQSEIENVAKNDITLYFTLRDKLSDHGLIGVVIMKKHDTKTLFIDTWLMSCRVLKRGMEEFIVNKIMETAQMAGFKKVMGEYIPSPKNMMVADIYEKFGFIRESENIFAVDVAGFNSYKTFIKEQIS